jgi:hypothetical protein
MDMWTAIVVIVATAGLPLLAMWWTWRQMSR